MPNSDHSEIIGECDESSDVSSKNVSTSHTKGPSSTDSTEDGKAMVMSIHSSGKLCEPWHDCEEIQEEEISEGDEEYHA